MTATLTQTAREHYLRDITRELQYAHSGWILDDAVMGCLTETTATDLLQDFGLSFDVAEHRAILREAIQTCLAEGW